MPTRPAQVCRYTRAQVARLVSLYRPREAECKAAVDCLALAVAA
ncbi:hypothetical protein [Streptomyces sp. GQFP]|nr:hypothetical protein [Streptomyces sp. GQFP]